MREELSIDECKRIQLEILDFIDRFCCQNGINYSLGYGTLLGAVRHKGYIPWDDDIDIWMLREDYLKFESIFNNKETRKYEMGSIKFNRNWQVPFLKVYDTTTLVIHKETKTPEYGVFVDIFPLDEVPNNNRLNSLRHKLCKIMYYMISVKVSNLGTKIWKNCVLLFLKFILTPFTIHGLAMMMERIASRRNNSSFKGVQDVVVGLFKRPIPNSIFQNMRDYDFEDRKFKGVVDYDMVLKNIYGEYMKLPPENERIPKHSLVAYRL